MKDSSTTKRCLTIAHRGVTSQAHENTLEAFRLVVENRDFAADGIELDIHSTRDNGLVVHHDPTLPDGRRLDAMPAQEVADWRAPAGWRIPTLGEVLAATSGLKLFIEAKGLAPAADDRLCQVIDSDADPSRCHVHSFDHRVIARFHAIAPHISLGILTVARMVDPVSAVRAAGATTLWQERAMVDEELVTECRIAGIGVIVWTVKSDAEAKRFERMGVVGVCRDY